MRCVYFNYVLNCNDLDYILNKVDIIMGCQFGTAGINYVSIFPHY